MAAIAHILKDMGNDVSGSDVNDYIFTEDELIKREINIYSFGEYDINNVDIVICGHNFYHESIEVKEAIKFGKEVYEYHVFLQKLINMKYSIAICGSHGKTTSVGLLATIMKDYNPSYLRGDGMGKWTNSKYFIFEACEYKDHFLEYKPNEIIILNIDYDHNDYFKTKDDYIKSFINFSKNCKNRLYIHEDLENIFIDKNIDTQNILINKFGNKSNLKNGIFTYKDIQDKVNFYSVQTDLVNNELGLIQCALNNNISIKKIKENIKLFKGAKKRKEVIKVGDNLVVDDYAHHPKQMNVIIEEMKLKYPEKKIVAIFKPDRYSRILEFHKEIHESLSQVDERYIIDFPKYIKNDTKIKFNASIIGYKVYDENTIFELIKDYKNTIYLFVSSKDMSYLKKLLIDYKTIKK